MKIKLHYRLQIEANVGILALLTWSFAYSMSANVCDRKNVIKEGLRQQYVEVVEFV